MARKHDETYKLIFSQRAAVEELVRHFVGEDLLRRRELKAGDRLPPILPVTIYNGQARWRAATDISKLMAPVPQPLPRYLPRARYLLLDLQRIGERDPPSTDLVTSLGSMERKPSPENLRRVMRGLTGRFRGPGFDELRRALFSWVAGAAEAWQIPKEELARMQTATEDETMYERVKEMREQVHRDGIEKGLQQGLEQGLRRGRAEEGRALVGRLATRKFGARTAKQLSRVLEDITDPERLADVADAIIDCESDAELFARMGM